MAWLGPLELDFSCFQIHKCYFLASSEDLPNNAEPILNDAGWFQRHAERFLSQAKTLQSRFVNLLSCFANLHRHVVNFPRCFVSFQNALR